MLGYVVGTKTKPCSTKYEYKMLHDFDKRQQESAKVLNRYPDKIPVIVERMANSDMPDIDKHKYILPKDFTIGQFMFLIRKKIKIDESKSIFIFIDNVIPMSADRFDDVYSKYKDKDGFLYVTYVSENTFGCE